jgi:hypothetical protein
VGTRNESVEAVQLARPFSIDFVVNPASIEAQSTLFDATRNFR